MERHIVIGDCHSCLDEVKELIDKLAITLNDKVIFLGDLVDKGLYPVETVKFVHDSGFESLVGNHEEKLNKAWKHEKRKTLDPNYKIPTKFNPERQKIYNGLKDLDLLEWLATRPAFFYNEKLNVVGVHAGLVNGLTIQAHERRELLHRRYVTPEGKFLSLKDCKKQKDAVHWSSTYSGPYQHVFYGHSVLSIDSPYIQSYREGITTYGIDQGCVHGGYLTAAIITKDSITFQQVKARQIYTGLLCTGPEIE